LCTVRFCAPAPEQRTAHCAAVPAGAPFGTPPPPPPGHPRGVPAEAKLAKLAELPKLNGVGPVPEG
jgi:hypothetical protein